MVGRSRQLKFFGILSLMIMVVAAFNFARSSQAAEMGTLTIVNVNGEGVAFGYNISGPVDPAGDITLADGASHTSTSIVNFAVDATVFQTNQVGFELSIECVDASNAPVAIELFGDNGMRVSVSEDDQITCTFTNTNIAGSVTVINQTTGPDSFDYLIGSTEFTLAPSQSYSQTQLNPGDYTVFQTERAGYALAISCTGGDVALIGSNGVTMSVDSGEDIVCTFNNNFVAGSFTIEVASNTADTFDFTYGSEAFSLSAGQQYSQTSLNPGDYSVFQTILPGYELTISCTGGDSAPIGSNGITMMVDANEDIVCTFNNNYVGSNVSITTNINGGTAASIDYVTNFGDFAHANGESFNASDVLPGNYNLFITIPTGYALDFSCTGTTVTPIGANGATLSIAANENAVCTTNMNYVAGTVTINNSATPASATPFAYATSFGNFDINSNDSYAEPIVMPGNEIFIFQTEQEGYDLAINCTGTNVSLSGSNGVFITLENNEDIVCDFVNTDENGGGTGQNLLTNGDFELGQDNSWREQSTWGFDLVVHESAYGGTVAPQSGEYLAWLGGARYEKSYISQAVELPAGENAVVNFSYWIESRDWCGYDWGMVYIYDGTRFYRVWAQTLCRGTETDGWVDAEIDVSDFAGQSVRVLFNAKNDSVYRSSMYLDDVSVTTSVAGRSATTEITGADPKDVGTGDAEEVMNGDADAVTDAVEKPERDENNRDYQDDLIQEKAVEGVTAVSLSSANVESAGSSVATVVALLATIVTATAALVGKQRRNER